MHFQLLFITFQLYSRMLIDFFCSTRLKQTKKVLKSVFAVQWTFLLFPLRVINFKSFFHFIICLNSNLFFFLFPPSWIRFNFSFFKKSLLLIDASACLFADQNLTIIEYFPPQFLLEWLLLFLLLFPCVVVFR